MNNPVIISTGIALAGLIVTIFTALWLQQRFVAKLISQQTDLFDAKLGTFDAKLGTLRQLIESQTELFEARIAAIRVQLDSMEGRIARIERMLDGILKPEFRR